MATKEQCEKVRSLIERITDKVAPAKVDVETEFAGLQLKIHAGIFDPSRGRSTAKMAKTIRLLPPHSGDKLIEVGAGSGALALFAANLAATDLTVTDINPAAVSCATENILRYNVRARIVVGDLFDALPKERFDYIIFNAPTFHPSLGRKTLGQVALWDTTAKVKQRFIDQLEDHLSYKPYAKALLMYSRYVDYDSLAALDFKEFSVSQMHVDRDELSEAGVLVLMRDYRL